VALGGTVHIGAGTHIGVGAVVRNNRSVGEWSVVGVGAAVVTDLPSDVVAYGVPARVVRLTGNPER
jgi:acetyltransferase-like isoleucine patch superfamily enzyme